MSSILFTWESGGRLGHMMQMLPLASGLVKRGHRVHVALRHLSTAAAQVFARAGVSFRQAPFKSAGPRPFARTPGFAHVLANTGWGETGELSLLAYAWRNLVQDARADMIVGDHSPTALLASRAVPWPVRRVLIGSGFCCPPDTCPLPALINGADVAKLAEDEAAVLVRANHVLNQWRKPPLERLGQLYSEVDETFLTTFPELEQYPSRTGAEYWGPVLDGQGGKAPQWPEGDRPLTPTLSPAYRGEGEKRVFAYLKPFAGLEGLLKSLSEKGCRTLLYIDGLDVATRRKLESPTMRFERERLDLAKVAAECDLAVLHAGQGATAAMLLAGKPVLQIPLVLEQQLTARAVAKLGAGETASPNRPESIREKLDALLASDRYAAAARAFAAKYTDFDPAAQVERMVGRMEELLEDSNGRALTPRPARGPRVPDGIFRA